MCQVIVSSDQVFAVCWCSKLSRVSAVERVRRRAPRVQFQPTGSETSSRPVVQQPLLNPCMFGLSPISVLLCCYLCVVCCLQLQQQQLMMMTMMILWHFESVAPPQ